MATGSARPGVRDGVAVITIDNPPVNALGADTIGAILERLAIAERDAGVTAIVLGGANGNFSGGADIRVFGKPAGAKPTARDLIARIESSAKPFVAALDGNALGAGLEVALACDYRVATRRARLGLPEVTLGLLPGAGGTQRLPRLIGLEAALAMIVSGEPAGAERAHALGLVDRLADEDPFDEAVRFAAAVANAPRRRTRDRTVEGNAALLARARERAQPEARGGLAAHRAIDAVEGALALPFEAGLARERELFVELLGSDQSKARRHLFFAERAAAKAPANGASPFTARTATVVGGGTMGTGIAMALANAGIRVTLVDVQPAIVERAESIIEGNYAASRRKGRLTPAQTDERLRRIRYATSLDAAADVDVVIEAVFEELNVKQEVFRALDRIARADAMLATNTSTLDIDAIAAVTARPEAVVGTHFFSPAHVMKLLEVVRGAATAPRVIADALALAKQLHKIGVVAGNCDGFIGNRMLAHYKREADFLLEEGATPQAVDRVIRDFGFPMGPFAMFDLAGIDVSWRIRKRRLAAAPPKGRYSKLEDELCELGRFGQKTGAGFYRYENGDRTPIPDPFVDDLIAKVAAEAGIVRRTVGDDEIRKRCIYPLINEAAAILEDGIAARPGDVDVVWVYGYGFPAFRGGPLHYADAVGLATVYEEMLALEAAHGAYWQPAALLRELATSGGSFETWNGARA